MFLVITKDTVLFTAITFLLNKSQVVHVQDEDDIDLVLHQHCHIIIDTLMNNVFHSAMAEKNQTAKTGTGHCFFPFYYQKMPGRYSRDVRFTQHFADRFYGTGQSRSVPCPGS